MKKEYNAVMTLMFDGGDKYTSRDYHAHVSTWIEAKGLTAEVTDVEIEDLFPLDVVVTVVSYGILAENEAHAEGVVRGPFDRAGFEIVDLDIEEVMDYNKVLVEVPPQEDVNASVR